MSKPKGVAVILVHPRGHVAAVGTDFSADKPGGFDLLEAQKNRAEQACQSNFLRSHAPDELARQVGRRAFMGELLRDLVQHEGFKVHTEVIGHDQGGEDAGE